MINKNINLIKFYIKNFLFIFKKKNIKKIISELIILFKNKFIKKIIKNIFFFKKKFLFILKFLLKNKFDKFIINFIKILIKNNHLIYFKYILYASNIINNFKKKILYINIYNILKISKKKIQKIIFFFKKKFFFNLKPIIKIKNNLINGLIIKINNIYFNKSIKYKLKKLFNYLKI